MMNTVIVIKNAYMEINMLITGLVEKELFAAATQFYVRLRRVNGRVIDVQYMIENREYAEHVLNYAEKIIDGELERHLTRLKELFLSSSKINDPVPVVKIEESQPQPSRTCE